MKKFIVLLIFLCFFSSCATVANERSLKDLPDSDFSVQIPKGWWKPRYVNKYFITKDGPFFQYVLIQQRPLDRPFRHTKKKFRKGMLPLESAGIIIDEMASDRNITNFRLLENAPAVIDQHEGFKILFTYKDKKGATYKTLYYGFISGESFYNLRYNAALKDYYEKDIVDFKRIFNSFKLDKG
jgi:hypothetical protein